MILAEIYYQRNNCYNALIMVNSALAFMESEGNENIWIVGRFFKMCIMIVTGQVSAIYPLVDGMEARIYKIKAFEYFEKCLSIASERDFVRLLADEGEAMYHLAKKYRRETATKDTTPQITKKEKEVLLLLADGKVI